jgi:hypothetical protein
VTISHEVEAKVLSMSISDPPQSSAQPQPPLRTIEHSSSVPVQTSISPPKLEPVPSYGNYSKHPIWKWQKDSCSLDSAMLVAWRLYLAIDFTTDDAKKIKAANGELARSMINWITAWEGGPWAKMTVRNMTSRRDEVRQRLKEKLGVEIDAKSAISGLWQFFLPDHLVRSQLYVIYGCNKPKCMLEWAAKKPLSPLTVMIQREYQSPGWSVQQALDASVTAPQYGFLTDSVEIAIAVRREAPTARDTRPKKASGQLGLILRRHPESCM